MAVNDLISECQMLDPGFLEISDSDTPILSESKAVLWRNVGTGGARVNSIRLF